MTKSEFGGYRAVHEAVGWRDLSDRGKLCASGPDHRSFLHAVLSNDVQGLSTGEGRHAALLTATGKILSELFCYRMFETFLMDVAAESRTTLLEKLDDHIIMDDVVLEDVTKAYGQLAFDGPGSPDLLKKGLSIEPPPSSLEIRPFRWEDSQGWIIRRNELSDWGFELLAPPPTTARLVQHLQTIGTGLGLERVQPEAFEILRLERGTPRFGVDFTSKNNPLEVQLNSVFSLSKGCYPGQEVLAKATNIGGVARLLVRLRFLDQAASTARAGAPIWNEEDEIGWITSGCRSPLLNSSIALGYVKRRFASPGGHYSVGERDAPLNKAQVVENFA